MGLTFSELGDRNNRTFLKKDRELRNVLAEDDTLLSEARDARIQEARDRVADVLDARVELVNLASTQNQREAYGIERFHEEFVMLRTLKPAIRHRVWNEIPNSRFKRFQELFSHPHQIMVPAFTVDDRGSISFLQPTDWWNTCPLSPCLVSADRIPDELAASLKLGDFSGDRGQPYERLKKKHRAIPALKKLWESLVPLQKGHHRVLVVEMPDTTIQQRYPGIADPDATILGTILYTREDPYQNGSRRSDAERPPNMRQVQHFRSVYEAERKTMHVRASYEEEVDTVADIQGSVGAYAHQLDGWRKDTPEEVRQSIRERGHMVLSHGAEVLEHCINPHKTHARDLFASSVELKDKRGRVNPSASMTKITTGKREMGVRVHEIAGKSGYNEQDHVMFRKCIREAEAVLKERRDAVSSGTPALANGLSLFGQSALSPKQIDAQVRGLLARMNMTPINMQQVTLQPFRTYAETQGVHAARLDQALRRRDRNTAMDEVVYLHVIGKFQALRVCVERMKMHVIDHDRVSLTKVREFIARIKEIFDAREVFPERTIGALVAPFLELRGRIDAMETRVLECGNLERDVTDREALYGELKEFLDGIDVETMVRNLS